MEEKLREISQKVSKISAELGSICKELHSLESPSLEKVIPITTADEILNTKEAARLLKVSIPTLLSCVKSGEIKATRIGHNWKFSKNYILSIAN